MRLAWQELSNGRMSRDLRTLMFGTACIGLMLLMGKVIPAVVISRRATSSQLGTARSELSQDREVVARRGEVAKSLDGITTTFLGLAPAFLKGDAASQGAATLASVVSDAADANGVHLSSLQPGADSSARTLVVPVVVHASGTGDIRGVSGMLRDLEGGVPLVEIRQVMIAQPDPNGPPDHMEALHIDFTVRALYMRVPGSAEDKEGQ